jgi:hydroxymethylglutaryl-CoA reductase (NADPH)
MHPLHDQEVRVENFTGVVHLPVSVVGPVKVNGRQHYVPLAHTEGALTATVSRGVKAINLSGGARVYVLDDKMSRTPLFAARDVAHAARVAKWVGKNSRTLARVGKGSSRFTFIRSVRPQVIGPNVMVRVEGETGDAMGMNMLTIAARRIGERVARATGARLVSESSNMDTDKKSSSVNLQQGRGKYVVAEVLLKPSVIRRVLKTTPERLLDIAYRKNLVGSAAAGSHGFNAHFANMVAACFIATGQDAAHVVEGSQGFSLAEKRGKNVLFTVTMPSLQVGTVGGGTRYPTQQAWLQVMRVAGSGRRPGVNAKRLAEVIAGGAVLPGEISTLAAQVEGELAAAHKRLGR